jgi:hypothetical protein
MATYRPDTGNLLRTVGDFLAHVAPGLQSGDRYQALVCQHILAMVARELAAPPTPEADDAALAAAIRAGAFDGDWDALLTELLNQAKARVAVVKPDHLTDA